MCPCPEDIRLRRGNPPGIPMMSGDLTSWGQPDFSATSGRERNPGRAYALAAMSLAIRLAIAMIVRLGGFPIESGKRLASAT